MSERGKKVKVTAPNGKSVVLVVRSEGKYEPYRIVDIKGDFEQITKEAMNHSTKMEEQ